MENEVKMITSFEIADNLHTFALKSDLFKTWPIIVVLLFKDNRKELWNVVPTYPTYKSQAMK